MLESKLFKFKIDITQQRLTKEQFFFWGRGLGLGLGGGVTVSSHWLACLLAQGTQQRCKVSTISSQNSPFMCNFSSHFLPDWQILPKGAASFWSNTGKRPRKRKSESRVDRTGCVGWSSLRTAVSFESMYNTTVCKRCMHVNWRRPFQRILH